MAVKNERIRVYFLDDVGTDGRIDQQWVLQPSGSSDFGYWAAVSYVSGTSVMVGAQPEHRVLYAVTVSVTTPLENDDDVRIAVLGAADAVVLVLEVQSVGALYRNTGEKQARCMDVSDAKFADQLTN